MALYSGNMGTKQGLELLASARPVVATAHKGNELTHVLQGCGLVVPPEDVTAFADALMALADDPALRERLGSAGFSYAQAHLDKEAVLGKFEADLGLPFYP